MGTIENRGMWENESETPIIHQKIPAITLTTILDQVEPEKINLLSLDVEGYELNALRGIDFEKYKPEVIVVECYGDAIIPVHDLLSLHYGLDNKISDRDYVYILK